MPQRDLCPDTGVLRAYRKHQETTTKVEEATRPRTAKDRGKIRTNNVSITEKQDKTT